MRNIIRGMNILCLLIWLGQFVLSIVKMCQGDTIHPAVFMCSVVVCMLFYLRDAIDPR